MRNDKKNLYEKYLAEASSVMLAEVVAYPLHTVWTVQQEGNSSFRHAFKTIGRNPNGYRELYRGFSIATVSGVIGIFPYLAGANYAIHCFGDNHVGQLMQGPFAQAFAAVVWGPAIRMIELEQASISHAASNPFKKLSVFDKSTIIWRNSGVRGFYRGTLPQWSINSVNDALGFWLRARLLHCFSEEQAKQPGPQLFSTLLGFAMGYFLLTPLSAVETRLRIHETNPSVFLDTAFFPAMRTLYRQRGARGFFVGATAAGLYGAASSLPVACSGCFDYK